MRIFRSTLASCLLLLSLERADAASLRISPIGIDILSNQRASSLTLVNSDSEPLSVQVRIFKWSQVNGEDRLELTNDLLVSPPAATVPAGASYMIRVARPSVTPVQGEQSYRLFIDELPKPIDPRAVGQGISMVLRTSMPVFVVDKKAIAKLVWRVWQDDKGIHAEVVNAGQRHAKISSLTLQPGSGPPIAFGPGLNGYVLAGMTRRFDLNAGPKVTLPTLAAGSPLTLTAINDGAEIKETVSVGPR
jgi:fimbrial chaperone protein